MKALLRLIACLAFGFAGGAHAHAFLEKTEPSGNATLAAAPAEIRLWFSEPIEGAFSKVEVTDAQGRHFEAGRSSIDPRDPAVLRVAVGKLAPGSYTATWRVASVDTHVTEGRFVFLVKP
jgi:methionine-rich copper-binding protein CopC